MEQNQPLSPRTTSPRSAPKPKVLIAEDDAEMRSILARALARGGYQIETAGSGLELFDLLRTSRSREALPALVVSDIKMPGLTGLQVLHRLREWEASVPVILITAFADEEVLEAAEALGVVTVLSKPFDVEDLRIAVEHLLG